MQKKIGPITVALALLVPATTAAQERKITSTQTINDALRQGDKMRPTRIAGATIDSFYDCHTIKLAAGEGVRISAWGGDPKQKPATNQVWARIANPECTGVLNGLANEFASRAGETVGILVERSGYAPFPVAYRLTIERFDAAAIERAAQQTTQAYEAGAKQFAAKDFAGAVDSFQAAARLSPRDPQVLLALGVAQQHKGDLAAGIATHRRLLELKSGERELERRALAALYQSGFGLLDKQDFAGAEPVFQFLYKTDDSALAAAQGLARARIGLGKSAFDPLYALVTRLPLDRQAKRLMLAELQRTEGEAQAAGNTTRREAAAKAAASIPAQIEQIPVFVEIASVGRAADKTVVKVKVTGNAAPAGSRHSLFFTLHGWHRSTEAMLLEFAAPARGETVELSVEKKLPEGLTIEKYKHSAL